MNKYRFVLLNCLYFLYTDSEGDTMKKIADKPAVAIHLPEELPMSLKDRRIIDEKIAAYKKAKKEGTLATVTDIDELLK